MGTENNASREQEQPEDEGDAQSGFDELLYSLGQALRTKQSKEAIALLIQRCAEDLPNRTRHQRCLALTGYLLTAFVLAVVGTLGYLKVITNEITGTLIGAVVGGIFYGQRR